VLSARLERAQPLEEVAARLNAHLPDDVGIHLVAPCQTGFHAAFRATSKEYRYQLSLAEAGDLDRLREAAACVPGTRNFKVFHFKTSLEQPRTVSTVEVLTSFGGVTLRFVGAGFARYMVRMLVGGLTAVARGETPLEVFCAGLTRGEAFHCPTAAPEPLTLWSIGYPSECDPFTPAQRAAFVWPPAA
jgi:tRNA pseudouridine38-40 synthase